MTSPSLATLKISMPKRTRDEDSAVVLAHEIYFKAYTPNQYRRLSNLFGHVEWGFQMVKFKEGCAVWTFMRDKRDWMVDEFKEMFIRLYKADKTDKSGSNSYIDTKSGEIATGIIPKLLSAIAKPRGKSTADARKRLGVILGKSVTEQELEDWRVENVNPELDTMAKDELMLRLLREKFALPRYKELLLQTGDAALHEQKGRGPPNRYEWQKKPLTDAEVEENYTRGGDVLGKLMMQVRSEVR